MNANTNGVMARTITSTTKYNSLTLEQNGLILKYGKNKEGKILFSEVDKIYIKMYKLKTLNGFLFGLFPMLLIFLFSEFIKLNIELSMALTPIIPAFVKINHFKRFGLIIILKDGSVFRKHVPLKLKGETIELINEVKRKCLYNYTNAYSAA